MNLSQKILVNNNVPIVGIQCATTHNCCLYKPFRKDMFLKNSENQETLSDVTMRKTHIHNREGVNDININ